MCQSVYEFIYLFAYIPTFCMYSHSCEVIYACMCAAWTSISVLPGGVCCCCISLCVRLMVISIARGPLMAHTCVSHYRKLRILLSKSRMFHSHFVISTEEEAARHPAESLKLSWQIFGATAQEILVRVQRHGCISWKGNRVLLIVSGINIRNN